MALALAVSDNQDGSGALATITGSAGGSANSVYTQAIGATAWTLSGTRTGDGTVSLSLAQDSSYLSYTASVSGGVTTLSNVVLFTVTNATDSPHWRFLTAVSAKIAGLTMAGSPNANMMQRLTTQEAMEKSQQIWVTADEDMKEMIYPPLITNLAKGVAYPAMVAVYDRRDALDSSMDRTYLKWRFQLLEAFRQGDPLPINPGSAMTTVDERSILNKASLRFQNIKSFFVVWGMVSVERP